MVNNAKEYGIKPTARAFNTNVKTVWSVKGLKHHTIPPAAHTWQSDVGTAHRLIGGEFYEEETLRSRDDFLAKTTAYNLIIRTLYRVF